MFNYFIIFFLFWSLLTVKTYDIHQINYFIILAKSEKEDKFDDDAIPDVYTARVSLILSKRRSTRLSARIDRESGNFGSIQEGDETTEGEHIQNTK